MRYLAGFVVAFLLVSAGYAVRDAGFRGWWSRAGIAIFLIVGVVLAAIFVRYRIPW